MSLASPQRRGLRASRRRWVWVALLLSFLSALAALAWLVRSERWSAAFGRTPMELVRYAERRLSGHPRLEAVFGPGLQAVRRTQENEPPASLQHLGKGQQPASLALAGYDAGGRPIATVRPLPAASPARASLRVDTVDQLVDALVQAQPGQVIELAAGRYALTRTLETGRAGEAARPITLRAARPGTVELQVVDAVEGVRVTQPYWVFENLDWRGACNQHDRCEHAYHVVGAARATVILNNRLVDFNAAIRIDGKNGFWPDDGLLQYSTLTNAGPRRTGLLVSAIALVGASGWQVVDNHIERVVKQGGDRISYAMCIKGAGERAAVERNLVVCTPEQVSQPGLRVGISLGCGGTEPEICRDGRCDVEQAGSVVANNVVAHCNDFGIDLHRARGVLVSHNTLVNTEGIDARHGSTEARVVGNLLEGLVRARDGARVNDQDNAQSSSLDRWLAEPNALDLRWLQSSDRTRPTPETERDFCGVRRPPLSPPGATVEATCAGASRPASSAPKP